MYVMSLVLNHSHKERYTQMHKYINTQTDSQKNILTNIYTFTKNHNTVDWTKYTNSYKLTFISVQNKMMSRIDPLPTTAQSGKHVV